jgi:hypothetical protein
VYFYLHLVTLFATFGSTVVTIALISMRFVLRIISLDLLLRHPV